MYGIIYKATNLINGKLYIGQTNRKLETRMKRHLYDAKIYNKTYFHRAINKYGEENFKWEVIDVALDQDELDSKEKYWIKKLKTYYLLDNSNGYNMTDGGYGASGEHHPSFNKEVKVSTRKKISSTLSGKYMGSNNVNSKPVIQIGLNGEFVKEFDSMSSAKRETGILHISDACNGKIYSAGNYIWIYKDDYDKEIVVKRVKKYNDSKIPSNSKSVIQLSFDGKFIAKYNNSSDAIKSIGKGNNAGNIKNCCLGKLKEAYGYIWIFESDYDNDCINYRVLECKNRRVPKKIVQLTKDGKFVAEFNAIKDACRKMNKKSNRLISKCCKSGGNIAYGYKWMFMEDYIK